MRYARSGRAYAQSRNVLVRDVRVPGFCPDTYDIPLCVLVNYEKRTFLSWCAYGDTVSLYTYALAAACARATCYSMPAASAPRVYMVLPGGLILSLTVRAFR